MMGPEVRRTMHARVSCKACKSYRSEELVPALRSCLEALGGIERHVRPGDRVLCKVNLLMPVAPERAVTTHPELLRAVIREVRGAGGVPLVGDNPAAPGQRIAMMRAGLLDVVRSEGAELADMRPTLRVESHRESGYQAFELSRAALDADLLLNLPKLKTHALTYLTLALKNLFGLIPGLEKSRWHYRAQSPEDFASLIVDLYAAVTAHRGSPPRILHLLDGVTALDGDGPGIGGRPRESGLLLASEDGVALDRVACQLVGLDPTRLLTCTLAEERGLGCATPEQIDLAGDPLHQLEVPDFRPPAGTAFNRSLSGWFVSRGVLRDHILEHPIVRNEHCTGCGKCAQICPAKAITISKDEEKARIDLKPCIRCYCCAEVCPEAAIHKSDTPLLGKVMYDQRLLWASVGTGLLLLGGLLGLGVWWLI